MLLFLVFTYLSLNGLGGLEHKFYSAMFHGTQQDTQVLHVVNGLGAAVVLQQLFPVVEIAHGVSGTISIKFPN